jgi:hypothetical protein
MAATKKNAEIAEEKKSIAEQIIIVNELICDACKRVPKAILAGHHQMAVEWKDLAEKNAGQSSVPRRGSLRSFREKLAAKQATLKKLKAE